MILTAINQMDFETSLYRITRFYLKKRFIFFICVFFIINFQFSNSQTLNNQTGLVNFIGKIIDVNTGSPIEANVTIEDDNGKKINAKSNSLTGEFATILKSNKTYKFTFLNFDVHKQIQTAATIFSDNYEEQHHSFHIIKLNPGLTLFEIDGFDKKSNSLTNNAKDLLTEIESIIKTNRGVVFDFVISANSSTDDNNHKKSTVKKSKSKSKSKSKTKSSYTHSVVDSRVNNLKSYIENINWFKGKVSIIPDYTNSSDNSFTVIVKDIKNPFK